jgi:O-antigen/teichoic acid export membrane protein
MAQTVFNQTALRQGLSFVSAVAQIKAWLRDTRDHSVAQRTAGFAYAIRVASAAAVYLAQIALARWMGNSEFGLYVYVWTWVLLVGDFIHLGLPLAAQRLIPSYSAAESHDRLRGFIFGAWRLAFGCAIAGALAGAGAVKMLESALDPNLIWPLYLACLTLPFFTLSIVLDGIARNYNWIGLALAPHFLLRPLVILVLVAGAYVAGLPSNATTAMTIMVIATSAMAAVQLVLISRRLANIVAPGARRYELKTWLATSVPMILVWGFYTVLTYTDIIVLQQFRPPADVAHYYGAARTLLLVSFVYFSVAAAAAHRFTAYHLAGDREGLEAFVASTVQWTFWPSLLATVLILALGWPLLRLFGPSYVAAYPVMFVLAIGLLARASVGPAERLLNMLDAQRICAAVYAAAFAINLIGCIVLVPRLGIMGAAVATSLAIVFESAVLYFVTKRRFNLDVFVFCRTRMRGSNELTPSFAQRSGQKKR